MSSIDPPSNQKLWNILNIPTSKVKECERFGLILLNQPIIKNESFLNIWNQASIKVCADGGANRLFDTLSTDPKQREDLLPDYICGDFDSLRPEVKHYYQQKGVIVKEIDDQNSTDLTKCYQLILEVDGLEGIDLNLIIMGGIGGRFDHSLASIQSLYRFPTTIQVILFGPNNLTLLLQPDTHHVLYINHNSVGPSCGLLPIGNEVPSVTTKGLKWDLENHPSKFGGLVSTSNLVVSDQLTITCQHHPIVFTIEIK